MFEGAIKRDSALDASAPREARVLIERTVQGRGTLMHLPEGETGVEFIATSPSLTARIWRGDSFSMLRQLRPRVDTWELSWSDKPGTAIGELRHMLTVLEYEFPGDPTPEDGHASIADAMKAMPRLWQTTKMGMPSRFDQLGSVIQIKGRGNSVAFRQMEPDHDQWQLEWSGVACASGTLRQMLVVCEEAYFKNSPQ